MVNFTALHSNLAISFLETPLKDNEIGAAAPIIPPTPSSFLSPFPFFSPL